MIVKDKQGNIILQGGDYELAAAYLHEAGIDPATVTITPEPHEVVHRVRQSIANHAGDVESLLGTVADVAQMLLVWHCELVEAAKTATTVAQLKAAITASPLAAETAKLVADTKAGNVRWPYQLKGAVKVTDDVERRATIAHDAIQAGPKAKL